MAKSKAKKLPKLPHTIFAKYEEDQEPYLLAYERETDAVDADSDVVTTLGTYRLVATRRLRKVVTEALKEQD